MLYIYNSRKKTAGRGRCLPPTRPLLARPPPPPPAVLQLGRPPEAEADEAEAEAEAEAEEAEAEAAAEPGARCAGPANRAHPTSRARAAGPYVAGGKEQGRGAQENEI